MSDETDQILNDLRAGVFIARTDWLTQAGDVSRRLLEQAITIGAALGTISWDEAIEAFQRVSAETIATGMVRSPAAVPLHDVQRAFLAHLHVTRGNPNCVCRTTSCGHRASEHTGPNGACTICEQECWL